MENHLLKELLQEVTHIKRCLIVLAQDKLTNFQQEIEQKYLNTEPRKNMYQLFDGQHTYKEIAKECNLSSEAVRKFAVLLEGNGIIEHIQGDNGRLPKRVF